MLGKGLSTSVNAVLLVGHTAVAIRAEAVGRGFAAQAGDRDLLLLAAICRLGIDIMTGRPDTDALSTIREH